MPSIVDGLFACRAGIQSHGTGIAVLADNISNANTTGFKQSRADFADLLAGNLASGSAINTGSGSNVNSVTPILTQGTFEFTGRGLDVGIDGNGYFVFQDPNTAQRYYSRAGNFKVDTDGNVLSQNGYQVLGFGSSGAGGLEALNVNQKSQTSVATANVTIGANLNSAAPLTSVPATPTFTNLNDSASFSTFLKVFDSLGASHTVTTYFFHTAASTWSARSYVDGADVTGGTAGSPSLIGSMTLTFGSDGQLATPANNNFTTSAIDWASGATDSSVVFNFDPITQFASSSATTNIAQDGTGSGNVIGFSIESNGTLFAQLDNGQTASIGVVALANFANAESLKRVGGSVFAETVQSGEPVVGRPKTGTFGALESGALELSNSDIAGDFIKLISLQRGFQGSSRIINNINDLLSEIINLA